MEASTLLPAAANPAGCEDCPKTRPIKPAAEIIIFTRQNNDLFNLMQPKQETQKQPIYGSNDVINNGLRTPDCMARTKLLTALAIKYKTRSSGLCAAYSNDFLLNTFASGFWRTKYRSDTIQNSTGNNASAKSNMIKLTSSLIITTPAFR
ncbi:hypothetical protein [Chitinibacter sp. S2-10]|uniref:hypothetical protein n=1 Tax=Chitinibacter sp. S2-10 TaxID=3373597 RepID=UPI003977A044